MRGMQGKHLTWITTSPTQYRPFLGDVIDKMYSFSACFGLGSTTGYTQVLFLALFRNDSWQGPEDHIESGDLTQVSYMQDKHGTIIIPLLFNS